MSKQSANFYGSCEMEAHLDASLKSVSSLRTSLNALKFVAGPHFKKIDEQIVNYFYILKLIFSAFHRKYSSRASKHASFNE